MTPTFRELCALVGCTEEWEATNALFAALAQPEPVSVAERLPEPDDLDNEGTCWMFHPVNLHYCLCRPDPSVHTHWRPHWALPKLEHTWTF